MRWPLVTQRSWLPTKGQCRLRHQLCGAHRAPATVRTPRARGRFFWDGAANTLFWVDPKHKIVGLLFTQLLPPGDPKLVKAIRDAVYADDAEAFAGNKPTPGRHPALKDSPMKALHALLLAALVPLTSLAAPLVVPSRIESTLAGMVQRGEVVGVSAVVFENGKEAYFWRLRHG